MKLFSKGTIKTLKQVSERFQKYYRTLIVHIAINSKDYFAPMGTLLAEKVWRFTKTI